MEDGVLRPQRPLLRRVWREGATRRVSVGAVFAAAGGAAIASMRHLPPTHILRTSASCALLFTPFSSLREVVAGGFSVDGPVASAMAGGVAGYVGALAFTNASWKAVSHGAMVIGVSAGLFDVFATTVDFRWKAHLISRRDAAAKENIAIKPDRNGDVDLDVNMDMKMPVAEVVVPDAPIATTQVVQLREDANIRGKSIGAGNDVNGAKNETRMSGAVDDKGDLPVWMPGGQIISRDDYERLLMSQKATVAALQEEQDHIAQLLATIEDMKNDEKTSSPEELGRHLLSPTSP